MKKDKPFKKKDEKLPFISDKKKARAKRIERKEYEKC